MTVKLLSVVLALGFYALTAAVVARRRRDKSVEAGPRERANAQEP